MASSTTLPWPGGVRHAGPRRSPPCNAGAAMALAASTGDAAGGRACGRRLFRRQRRGRATLAPFFDKVTALGERATPSHSHDILLGEFGALAQRCTLRRGRRRRSRPLHPRRARNGGAATAFLGRSGTCSTAWACPRRDDAHGSIPQSRRRSACACLDACRTQGHMHGPMRGGCWAGREQRRLLSTCTTQENKSKDNDVGP